MVRMKSRRRSRSASTGGLATGLTPPVDDALKLAFSVVGTMIRACDRCPRRSCRTHGRCHAAAEGDFCQSPMPKWCDEIAAGMVVFAYRLLERRP